MIEEGIEAGYHWDEIVGGGGVGDRVGCVVLFVLFVLFIEYE